MNQFTLFLHPSILHVPFPFTLTVLAEDAIKAALKDYKVKQDKLRDANGVEAVAQWSPQHS